MSAPTPAPGDETPGEGYYPDPSIPGYVRYWNGGAWVPGTSRPAPKREPDEPAVVEETGPVFLDEEGPEDGRPEPATAWQADASHQSGFAGDRDRVSWPDASGAPEAPAPEDATPPAQRVSGLVQAHQARPAIEDGTGEPDPAEGTLTLRTRPANPVPQARPVPEPPVTPWKPPAPDPFRDLLAARTEGRPAPLGKRFVARLIDTVVLGALTAAAAVPLTGRAVDHIDGKIDAARQTGETVTVWLLDSTTAALGGALLGVFLVLGVLLDALPTAKWGRTLGKKLCGIDVRDIESHETPGFGAALRRWLVYGVLGILVVGVAGVLWCLVDRPWRQCWHDKAARTFVAG
ncbi:RDD family protein [Streptomyces sp. NPDC048567]|uniref:RDD family protein n=1 Tax=Streptomyces sp. NPDC048567 TaxID=3365570 RepID=UPI00371A7076